MPIDPNASNYGAFIPTSSVWDTGDINGIDVKNPEQLRELLVRMYQNLNNMALVLNVKDSGLYDNGQEFVTGAQYFPDPNNNSGTTSVAAMRNEYRTVINFGALPNTTTASKPHGIQVTPSFIFTRIIGASTNPAAGVLAPPNKRAIPLPYASATSDNIEVWVDDTNVYVKTNSANWIVFTNTIIVIQYIKF